MSVKTPEKQEEITMLPSLDSVVVCQPENLPPSPRKDHDEPWYREAIFLGGPMHGQVMCGRFPPNCVYMIDQEKQEFYEAGIFLDGCELETDPTRNGYLVFRFHKDRCEHRFDSEMYTLCDRLKIKSVSESDYERAIVSHIRYAHTVNGNGPHTERCLFWGGPGHKQVEVADRGLHTYSWRESGVLQHYEAHVFSHPVENPNFFWRVFVLIAPDDEPMSEATRKEIQDHLIQNSIFPSHTRVTMQLDAGRLPDKIYFPKSGKAERFVEDVIKRCSLGLLLVSALVLSLGCQAKTEVTPGETELTRDVATDAGRSRNVRERIVRITIPGPAAPPSPAPAPVPATAQPSAAPSQPQPRSIFE